LNNIIIFEGEYQEGVRKGKEYYTKHKGQVKFEGEYLDGKEWNGKGYNINGELIFEINNGNGNVKEYNEFNDKLEFEGEYFNGERNGKGKGYYYDGNLKNEGEYLNGKKMANLKNIMKKVI